jgi:nitrogenase molybdenum-cofactor synthesis protein NifE
MYTAIKARLPFLDVNQEREHGYAGYQGMVTLARQLTAPWKTRSVGRRAPPRALDHAHRRRLMAEIVRRSKPLSVSPLKTSQPLGASLAILGLDRAIPLLHGAQGCTAFAKVFLVRHFREPIPLQTTALDQISSIMGADDNLLEGLSTVCEKHRPAAVGLLTTG